MKLLLLSWGAGAVPEFLARHVDRPAEQLRIGMIDDAARIHGEQNFSIYERERLVEFGYRVRTVTLRTLGSAGEFAGILDELDVIYVCGGETFVLLEALERHGLREVLIERVRTGLPYIGLSAGAVIVGPSAEPVELLDDPALAPELTDFRGLDLFGAVPIPHADGHIPSYPPPVFERIRRIYAGRFDLAFIDDDQALMVTDGAATLVPSE